MEKTVLQLPEIKLVGIATRTSNAREMNPDTAQIPTMIQRYDGSGVAENTPHRKKPDVVFCVYTEYESDLNGEYTYFVGEQVTAFDEDLPKGFRSLTIAPQTYVKFTTQPGVMPQVVIDAWQKIWQMSPQHLTGNRSYIADFEIYDERARDPNNTVLDLYVGVSNEL